MKITSTIIINHELEDKNILRPQLLTKTNPFEIFPHIYTYLYLSFSVKCLLMYHCFFFYCYNYSNAAYPAVYGQFPQAIPQPLAAVAPSQREGKFRNVHFGECFITQPHFKSVDKT